MDPRQNPDTGAEQDDTVEPDETGRSAGGDVLTMCLFGAMVIIASICFVIWGAAAPDRDHRRGGSAPPGLSWWHDHLHPPAPRPR